MPSPENLKKRKIAVLGARSVGELLLLGPMTPASRPYDRKILSHCTIRGKSFR